MSIGGDDDAGGKRWTILVWTQRTEVVGNPLRQHWHDTVGKIDRIAALLRLAIERRAWPRIGGDIGDGDAQNKAAGIGRIGVALGVDRVVVVLGVHRVDGNERDRAPILAMGYRRGPRPLRLGNDLRAKDMRNLVRADGDEADRSFIV